LKTIGTVNIHGNTYYYNEVFFCKDTSCNPNDQTEALVVLGDQQVVNFSQTNDSKSYSDPTSGDGQIGIINKYRVMTLKGKPFAIDYEAGYNPKVSAASLMNLFTPLLQTLTVN